MKKQEMNEKFQKTLEWMNKELREAARKGAEESAWIFAQQIAGVAYFAEVLGIIDWEQMRFIRDSAVEAYRKKDDPLNDIC